MLVKAQNEPAKAQSISSGLFDVVFAFAGKIVIK